MCTSSSSCFRPLSRTLAFTHCDPGEGVRYKWSNTSRAFCGGDRPWWLWLPLSLIWSQSQRERVAQYFGITVVTMLLAGILFFKCIFNRRIIALQCCVGFCCMTTWISYKYAYIPSFLSLSPNRHPTPLGRYRALSWAPCAIHLLPTSYLPTHGSADMSVLLSQFVLPTASSTVSTRLFSMSASLQSILCVCPSAVRSLCLPLCSQFFMSASLQSILYVFLSAVHSLCLHLCS